MLSVLSYSAYLSFLNDSERIAVRNYQPTDDDVVRARLRTLGVQEYKFIFDHGKLFMDVLLNFIHAHIPYRSNGWSRMAHV